MPSVNQTIHDEIVAHGVALDQYGNDVVRRMVDLLGAADDKLLEDLIRALTSPPAFRLADLDARLALVQLDNEAAYQSVYAALLTEIRSLVEYEIEFQQALFRRCLPAEVLARNPLVAISGETIIARVLQGTFQGGTLEDWIDGATRNRLKAVQDEVRQQFAGGETADQILGEIAVDMPSYSDDWLEGSRRGLAAIIRTLLSFLVSVVCTTFYEENADLIDALQWVSVLDNRTTKMCRERAGLCYTVVDHEPIGHAVSWSAGPGCLHFCCRSKSAPIFKRADKLIGGFQMSTATRRAMDGRVPPVPTFADWLTNQSAERQNEVLGRTRARLHREEMTDVGAMYINSGQSLNLDELRARDMAALERAGQ